jgi:hypothetical protein
MRSQPNPELYKRSNSDLDKINLDKKRCFKHFICMHIVLTYLHLYSHFIHIKKLLILILLLSTILVQCSKPHLMIAAHVVQQLYRHIISKNKNFKIITSIGTRIHGSATTPGPRLADGGGMFGRNLSLNYQSINQPPNCWQKNP